jgi:hypothetical protein
MFISNFRSPDTHKNETESPGNRAPGIYLIEDLIEEDVGFDYAHHSSYE